MTATVRRIVSDGSLWQILVRRDQDSDPDRTPPPLTDLPDDVIDALRAWLKDPT
jgi:hypothetical protein